MDVTGLVDFKASLIERDMERKKESEIGRPREETRRGDLEKFYLASRCSIRFLAASP